MKLDGGTTNKFKASLGLHHEFQVSLGLQSKMGAGVEEDKEEQQDVEDEEKTVYL